MNEAGRLRGPTRGQSFSLVGVTLSSGQQVDHMNTSLRRSERSWKRRAERRRQRWILGGRVQKRMEGDTADGA